MAVSVVLTTDRASYNKGDQITATFVVTGAGPETKTITGTLDVDGVTYDVVATPAVTHAVTNPSVPGFTKDAANQLVWRGTA
jgi:hypothetical protein